MLRKLMFLLATLASAIIFSVSSPAFATVGVPSTPVNLSGAGQNADTPQVSISSTGLAVAVWTRSNGTNFIIQSSTSQSGASWSTPVDLSAVGQNATKPQVIVDSNGLAVAVWLRVDGGKKIVQSSSSLNGGIWSIPVNLSAVGQNADSPQVALDSTGLATSVWIRNDGSRTIVQSSTSLNGGIWSTPVNLSAVGQNADSPQVTIDSGGLATAVWRRYNGNAYILQSSTSLSGASWSTPVNVSNNAQSTFDPQVSVDSNRLAVAVWTRYDATNAIVESSTSLAGGTWTTPVPLTVVGQNSYVPQVAIDLNGLATAVWIRGNGFNNIVQASTSQSGGPWSAPVDLSIAGQDAERPQVAIDLNGLATAVWYRSENFNNFVQASTSQSGGPWSTPVNLSSAAESAVHPQVSIDSSGLAVVIWYSLIGSNNIIQSSTIYNAVSPIPPAEPELAETGVNLSSSAGLLAAGALFLAIGGTFLAQRKNSFI